jgi:hypothetical protein
MLTSWPEDDVMYPSWWDEIKEWTLLSGSIDWQKVPDDDHHWDVHIVHKYLYRMTGEKLWPNLHTMVIDGSVCAICQCPFGLE